MEQIEFRDGDRTFTCRAASSPATPGTLWWWLTITGESQRYAAFRAAPNDTERNLRPRVLKYYADMVAARERPREVRVSWGQRRAQEQSAQGAAAAAPESKPAK